MAFNVRIDFTGVCCFILNNDSTKKVKACVVMPDAGGTGDTNNVRPAPDGTSLRRHRAFVRFKLTQLARIADKTDLPVDAEGLWYVEGKRLTFGFDENDPKKNNFSIDQNLKDNLANMEEIAGSLADANPDIVQPVPSATPVAAQVLLHRGLLINHTDILKLSTWTLPSTLNGKAPALQKVLTHNVSLDLYDLSGVEIRATPIVGTGPTEKMKLQAVAPDDVTITISHLCSENPLRWLTTDIPLKDDEDFKWHHMLFSPQTLRDIELNRLNGLALPIPLVPLDQQPGGQGVNCPPSIGMTRLIDLDQFL